MQRFKSITLYYISKLRPMRQILLLLFVSLSTFSVVAQTLSFEQPLYKDEADLSKDAYKAYNRVQNTGDKELSVRWIREVNMVPKGWISTVCDTNTCYRAVIDSADFKIQPNSSSPVNPNIFFASPERGTATITIRVVEIGNRSNSAVSTFKIDSKNTVSTYDELSSKNIRLYPNPGSLEFRVKSFEPIGKIVLMDMLGKVVREYRGSQYSYDVSDLPDGIYLATVIGENGETLKTLRYSKRLSMP